MDSLWIDLGDGKRFEFTKDAQRWPAKLNTAIGGKPDDIYLVISDVSLSFSIHSAWAYIDVLVDAVGLWLAWCRLCARIYIPRTILLCLRRWQEPCRSCKYSILRLCRQQLNRLTFYHPWPFNDTLIWTWWPLFFFSISTEHFLIFFIALINVDSCIL